jgi:hypothetical protein
MRHTTVNNIYNFKKNSFFVPRVSEPFPPQDARKDLASARGMGTRPNALVRVRWARGLDTPSLVNGDLELDDGPPPCTPPPKKPHHWNRRRAHDLQQVDRRRWLGMWGCRPTRGKGTRPKKRQEESSGHRMQCIELELDPVRPIKTRGISLSFSFLGPPAPTELVDSSRGRWPPELKPSGLTRSAWQNRWVRMNLMRLPRAMRIPGGDATRRSPAAFDRLSLPACPSRSIESIRRAARPDSGSPDFGFRMRATERTSVPQTHHRSRTLCHTHRIGWWALMEAGRPVCREISGGGGRGRAEREGCVHIYNI